MKSLDAKTVWVKFIKVNHLGYIAKDTIFYGSGCHLKFYNVNTKETQVYEVCKPRENGDGIKSVGGHRTNYIFAYSEYIRQPSIIVKNYPDLIQINRISDPEGPDMGYKVIAFTESSLLLALGELPLFTIYVYNWRTGVKFAQQESEIFLDSQILRCGWSRPINVCQLSKNSKKIVCWDILTCCKQAVLEKQPVLFNPHKSDPFTDAVWTTDETLFITDIKGNVFTVDPEYAIQKLIECDAEGNNQPQIVWYKNGLVVSGPDNQLRHYKKVSGVWTIDWTLTLDLGLLRMISNRSDHLFCLNVDHELVRIYNAEKEEFSAGIPPRMQCGYLDSCLLQPMTEYVLTISLTNLLILELATGHYVTHMPLGSTPLCITENSEYPYAAIGYSDGKVDLISCYNPKMPKKMTSFHLSHFPIQRIDFYEEGKILVCANLDIGQFFVIEGLPGTQMKIVAHLNAERQIIDFMLIATRNCFRLFAIPVTSEHRAANMILRYCIINQNNINYKEYMAEDDKQLYYRIVPTDGPNRDRVFYALTLLSKNIHVIETKRGDNMFRLQSVIKTGHQTRNIGLRITPEHAITWGFDGFAMIRCNHFEEEVGMVLAHHRNYGGVHKAVVDNYGKYVLTLGKDSTLIVSDLEKNEIDEKQRKEYAALMELDSYQVMFKRPTYGYIPEGHFTGKNWIEVQEILKRKKEAEICFKQREKLLNEFHDIQNTLQNLITQNLEGPENEMIDLSEFYLDTAGYSQKKAKNKEECKKLEIYLRALIDAQDVVSQHLQDNYLKKMAVQGKVISGIFQPTTAIKYVLLPRDPVFDSNAHWIDELRNVQKFVGLMGTFYPWNDVTFEYLRTLITQPLAISTQDYSNVATLRLTEREQTQSQLTQIAVTGTVTQLYVDKSPGHYKQREIVTFHQAQYQQVMAELEVYKLKCQYNKEFEATMEEKYRRMESIIAKNARLRHIISEYNYFSPVEERIFIEIEDPTWTQKEQPWLIPKVLDEEITITPYVSPSEQIILDAKAAEEERIRLALLADDFRERALMAMMNGVLEVKWEDELRKDVPIPKCMLEKDPARFNEEDLRAVKDYEEKVAFLITERERYRKILELEFAKTSYSQREGIRKFNLKVRDCVEYKMQIDSGMGQENLKVNRARLSQHERITCFKKEENLKLMIAENEQFIAGVFTKIQILNKQVAEHRSTLESLSGKDKILEKIFKKDMLDFSTIAQEYSQKLYKKRPKVTLKNITSYSELFELSKCVISGERLPTLSNDSLDYLKAIDQLDQMVGLPAYINENIFCVICKHRKLRLEYEVKLRANHMIITDCEAAISTLHRRANLKKEKNTKLQTDLQIIHKSYLHIMHNLQIQVVIPRGLVEIPLTGSITDFEDAILVPKAEINAVNKLIKTAGEKKLATIRKNMEFRRKIMGTEWEHQNMRMKINDLIEEISDIENIKMCRDMQQYLRSKRMGRNSIGENTVEQEIETICHAYENAIQEKVVAYDKVAKQLNAYKTQTANLDRIITNINFDLCDLKNKMDNDLAFKENEVLKSRMHMLLRRGTLVNKIQENQHEIMVLQTELELLRLKTYPTFKYKLVNLDL